MKKIFTLIFAIALSLNVFAQCPLSTAVDFKGNDPEVTVTIDQVFETEVTATFTPNEYCAEFHYMLATQAELEQWMSMTGLDLPEYLQSYGFPADDVITHTFDGLVPNTEYQICAVGADSDGNLGDVTQESVITTPGGGGDIMPDFTGTDTDGNVINLYEILDGGQAVLINFFLNDDPYSQAPMPYITEAYSLFGCNQNDVLFMEICPNAYDEACIIWADTYGVKYPTISRGGGGNDIAQLIPVGFYPTVMIIRPDHTFAYRDLYPVTCTQDIVDALESEGCEQHDCEDAVDEFGANNFTVYPNPANEFVKISGDNINDVIIFNAVGQKIAEYEADNNELNVNTSAYENGVYFVKIGAKSQRFVVTH